MLVGYARVSTSDQDLTLQTDALTRAGCEKLFTDKVSGAKLNRPGLIEALNFVRAGDTLVISIGVTLISSRSTARRPALPGRLRPCGGSR